MKPKSAAKWRNRRGNILLLCPVSYSGIVTRVFTWFFIIIYITILLITGSNIIKLDRRNNEGRKNK